MRLEEAPRCKKRPLQMNVIRESLGEMNDTDGQGDKIDDGTQGHPSPFQVRTMERHRGTPDKSPKDLESLELQEGGNQGRTSRILRKSLRT